MENTFNKNPLASIEFAELWNELQRRCIDAIFVFDTETLNKDEINTNFFFKGSTAQVMGLLNYGQMIITKNIMQQVSE